MFVKHIGKHGDRKVAIVYRVIPDEEHMALVAYTETLPSAFHDSIMKVIESAPGQQAAQLADALFRNLLPDGRPILQTLHKEGMIKKVPTNQIIVTPNAQSHVRLDELNKIFDGMESGSEAAKKMKELDVNAGLVDPAEARRNAEMINAESGLDDTALAKQRIGQSERMIAEAKAMIVESERLQTEAYDLDPTLKPVVKTATRKKATEKTSAKDSTANVSTTKKAVSKNEAVD